MLADLPHIHTKGSASGSNARSGDDRMPREIKGNRKENCTDGLTSHKDVICVAIITQGWGGNTVHWNEIYVKIKFVLT